MQRVESVRSLRENSNRSATRKLANTPTLFGEIRQPEEGYYLVVPRTTGELRHYIPIGFLDVNTIASDALLIVPNAGLYEFGVLTSNVHMVWLDCVGGKLKISPRYSNDIVYRNFPWCNPTPEQKERIERSAQNILDVRAKYPNSSLADLYDRLAMPKELLDAHMRNDIEVMKAYGFYGHNMSRDDCLVKLFELYSELNSDNQTFLGFPKVF